MRSFNLRQVRLRPGEEYRDEIEVELEPFELGGERYLPVPDRLPAELAITKASTGTVFELGFTPACTGRATAASTTPCSSFRSQRASTRRRIRRAPTSSARPYLAGRQARPGGVGARRGRARTPRQDPVPRRLCRPLPGVRQEPERRAARARDERTDSRWARSRACASSSRLGGRRCAPLHSSVRWPSRRKKPRRPARDKRRAQHRSRRRG